MMFGGGPSLFLEWSIALLLLFEYGRQRTDLDYWAATI